MGTTRLLAGLFLRANGLYEDIDARGRCSIISDNSASVGDELSYIEGVRVEDLLELLLAALQSMARHPPARLEIINLTNGTFGCVVQVRLPNLACRGRMDALRLQACSNAILDNLVKTPF